MLALLLRQLLVVHCIITVMLRRVGQVEPKVYFIHVSSITVDQHALKSALDKASMQAECHSTLFSVQQQQVRTPPPL